MRIALIGSNGQLGTDIMSYFKEKGEDVIGLTQDEIDVCYIDKCEPVILKIKPDLVINTAAFHKVDLCEDEGEAAFKVNAVGVKNLCDICLKLDIPLMHFSTDFVFGADKSRAKPYTEDDCPAPVSLYGISKLAGEYVIKYNLKKYYLIRSCGLYGHAGSFGKGSNFVDLMIQRAEKGEKIRVVNDQILTPTSTKDLTEKLYELIHTGKYGLYHMTNTGQCSWYDFAVEIFKLAGLSPDISPITSEEFAAKAKRPAYSVLDNENLRAIGIKDMRPWQEALKDYIDEKMDK
ncbi:MAG: dTDP-4-dehydrorhamnose reductase [Actinobacteria bacterium]|nr:dTDP-4-dehydrorhamnose reductase [Cyanobacteriota bacterium]MCL5770732.1 dTDP-4-dehydrorhamnose reductase [Actinomycetota bacterium]